MNRRELLATTATTAAVAAASLLTDRAGAADSATRPATTRGATTIPVDVVWHDVRDWGVEGLLVSDPAGVVDPTQIPLHQVVLAWKVPVKRALGNLCFLRDAFNAGRVDSLAIKQVLCGVQDPHLGPATG